MLGQFPKGSYIEPSTADLRSHLKQAEAEGFWLDIEAPDAQDLEILEMIFDLHHLTIEDVIHQNQRPKPM